MENYHSFTRKASPFLRWAGSKRQLIPTLSKYWDAEYSRYVEPFVGSASLFFSIAPPRALLGDINAELISAYQQVKCHLDPLLLALTAMKKGRKHYLASRAIDPLTLTPSFRAARLIYLNRFCFNGLYRTNRAGQFNVPYGDGKRSGKIPSVASLTLNSILLKRAQLIVGDFEKTLEKVKPGDFVYMDPPFSVRARRIFNEYDASIFGMEDLKRLRSWMVKLAAINIDFLVSYAESDEANFLREGFYSETVIARRNIAGFTTSRKKASELLISNKKIDEAS